MILESAQVLWVTTFDFGTSNSDLTIRGKYFIGILTNESILPVASDPEVPEYPSDQVMMTHTEEQFVVVPLVGGDGPHQVLAHHHHLRVSHHHSL